MKNNKLVAIDLFCGCGGFSYGFQQAGFDMVLGIDMWKDATVTYKHNFPNACVINEDITSISSDDILSKLNMNADDIDVIIGGPPCQGFSVSGKRMIDDPRNKLYKSFVGLVDEIRPKVFVMENVALMTSMKDESGELFIDKIEKSFSKQGYSIVKRIVNAYEYGVPQSRERVILVGVRKDINKSFVFETPPYSLDKSAYQMELCGEKKKALTFKDATEDLQSLENGEKSYTDPLHWAITHPEHVIEWLIDVPEGHSAHENENPELRPPSGFNTTYKRNVWNEPCSTISTNFSMISGCRNVHPTDTRSLTIREAARVQSFPDEFVFCGNWGEIRKSIGNAVPPILARAIAKEIIGQIFKEE